MTDRLLNAETITILLSGNTLNLKRTDGAVAPVFYGSDGTAYMRHFEHGLLTGPWTVLEHGYAVDWDKGVGRMEWTLAYAPGEISYQDGNGTKRATLESMERGDSARLAG